MSAPAAGLANVTDHFTLIRSKDAGPFMLTLDLFFRDEHSRRAFLGSGVFTAERIGALKISFPRPIASGDFGDTDITGGQQYALVVELIAGLSVTGAGETLVVSP